MPLSGLSAILLILFFMHSQRIPYSIINVIYAICMQMTQQLSIEPQCYIEVERKKIISCNRHRSEQAFEKLFIGQKQKKNPWKKVTTAAVVKITYLKFFQYLCVCVCFFFVLIFLMLIFSICQFLPISFDSVRFGWL